MNKEEFKSELSKLGISLTDTQLESLEKYANETHYNIGRNIREVIAKNGGTMPEDQNTPEKSLKELEKENKQLEIK